MNILHSGYPQIEQCFNPSKSTSTEKNANAHSIELIRISQLNTKQIASNVSQFGEISIVFVTS